MNLRKLFAIIAVPVLAACFTSCKDKDETTEYLLLDGTLDFEIASYIEQKATLKLTPSGVSHPEGEDLGYAWKVSTPMAKPDTVSTADGSFTYTFPDTLKTYTVYCYAFAKGYTSSSKSKTCTVVKGGPDGSITNIDYSNTETVQIDGNTYHYVSAAGLDWMCRNIADGSAGVPYMQCEAMSDVFGRYYSYDEAQNICPTGWRLPTNDEWTALAEAAGESPAAGLMGNARFNDELMWEFWPAVGEITNSTGLGAIPSGYVMLGNKENGTYPTALFKGSKEYAMFWTSTSADDEDMAYYRYLICNQSELMTGKGDKKSFGASVRCVR